MTNKTPKIGDIVIFKGYQFCGCPNPDSGVICEIDMEKEKYYFPSGYKIQCRCISWHKEVLFGRNDFDIDPYFDDFMERIRERLF